MFHVFHCYRNGPIQAVYSKYYLLYLPLKRDVTMETKRNHGSELQIEQLEKGRTINQRLSYC